MLNRSHGSCQIWLLCSWEPISMVAGWTLTAQGTKIGKGIYFQVKPSLEQTTDADEQSYPSIIIHIHHQTHESSTIVSTIINHYLNSHHHYLAHGEATINQGFTERIHHGRLLCCSGLGAAMMAMRSPNSSAWSTAARGKMEVLGAKSWLVQVGSGWLAKWWSVHGWWLAMLQWCVEPCEGKTVINGWVMVKWWQSMVFHHGKMMLKWWSMWVDDGVWWWIRIVRMLKGSEISVLPKGIQRYTTNKMFM